VILTKKKFLLCKQRNQVAATIPHFWLKTFQNHPLNELLNENDIKVLEFLKELEVSDNQDPNLGFKLTFTFSENPFFENTQLWKEFRYGEDGKLHVHSSEIIWKEGKDITKTHIVDKGDKKRKFEETDSFFLWFDPTNSTSSPEQDLEIGEMFKYEIWPDPAKYYFGVDSISEEAEEDDEVEDEDVSSSEDEVRGEEDGEEATEEDDQENEEGHEEVYFSEEENEENQGENAENHNLSNEAQSSDEGEGEGEGEAEGAEGSGPEEPEDSPDENDS